MMEKLGRDLYGDIERGPGSWRGRFAALLGMDIRQLERIMKGESQISKPRARQYWALKALLNQIGRGVGLTPTQLLGTLHVTTKAAE